LGALLRVADHRPRRLLLLQPQTERVLLRQLISPDHGKHLPHSEWRKLIMANYVVPEESLLPYLPAGTELDRHEGRCYVSLVGFLFQDVRLKSVPIPFHRTFEEVNLRFYVQHTPPTGEARCRLYQRVGPSPRVKHRREHHLRRKLFDGPNASPVGSRCTAAFD